MPAISEMFAAPFQLGGPQMLERLLAPATLATLANENTSRPSDRLAATVLTSACRARRQTP